MADKEDGVYSDDVAGDGLVGGKRGSSTILESAAGSGSAEFLRTIGAHTVGKVCLRMTLYIRFELLPVTLIVTNSFAPSTDWDETS